MKNFLKVFLAGVGVVLLSIASSLSYEYYKDQYKADESEGAQFMVQLENVVTEYLDPTFHNIDEVLIYKQNLANYYTCDSILLSMPENTLVQISQVLIGRCGTATKESIANEYRLNYEKIYKHIKESEPVQSPQSANDTIKLPPSTTDDTIINNRHFKLVKETLNNGGSTE